MTFKKTSTVKVDSTGTPKTTVATAATLVTRPREKNKESWIWKDLFAEFKKIIKEKFGKSIKFEHMMAKYENLRIFMLNAEHNCRKSKNPLVGAKDDGKAFSGRDFYDGIFQKIRNMENSFDTRIDALGKGFDKYIKNYYYPFEVT